MVSCKTKLLTKLCGVTKLSEICVVSSASKIFSFECVVVETTTYLKEKLNKSDINCALFYSGVS